jgi:endogenous inhibitor of DNA gyrase (YacG/DUF329 family)
MSTQPVATRVVRCPSCGGASVYGPQNPYRPFCSERCRTQDLSAWATERYAVDAGPDDPSTGDRLDEAPDPDR